MASNSSDSSPPLSALSSDLERNFTKGALSDDFKKFLEESLSSTESEGVNKNFPKKSIAKSEKKKPIQTDYDSKSGPSWLKKKSDETKVPAELPSQTATMSVSSKNNEKTIMKKSDDSERNSEDEIGSEVEDDIRHDDSEDFSEDILDDVVEDVIEDEEDSDRDDENYTEDIVDYDEDDSKTGYDEDSEDDDDVKVTSDDESENISGQIEKDPLPPEVNIYPLERALSNITEVTEGTSDVKSSLSNEAYSDKFESSEEKLSKESLEDQFQIEPIDSDASKENSSEEDFDLDEVDSYQDSIKSSNSSTNYKTSEAAENRDTEENEDAVKENISNFNTLNIRNVNAQVVKNNFRGEDVQVTADNEKKDVGINLVKTETLHQNPTDDSELSRLKSLEISVDVIKLEKKIDDSDAYAPNTDEIYTDKEVKHSPAKALLKKESQVSVDISKINENEYEENINISFNNNKIEDRNLEITRSAENTEDRNQQIIHNEVLVKNMNTSRTLKQESTVKNKLPVKSSLSKFTKITSSQQNKPTVFASGLKVSPGNFNKSSSSLLSIKKRNDQTIKPKPAAIPFNSSHAATSIQDLQIREYKLKSDIMLTQFQKLKRDHQHLELLMKGYEKENVKLSDEVKKLQRTSKTAQAKLRNDNEKATFQVASLKEKVQQLEINKELQPNDNKIPSRHHAGDKYLDENRNLKALLKKSEESNAEMKIKIQELEDENSKLQGSLKSKNVLELKICHLEKQIDDERNRATQLQNKEKENLKLLHLYKLTQSSTQSVSTLESQLKKWLSDVEKNDIYAKDTIKSLQDHHLALKQAYTQVVSQLENQKVEHNSPSFSNKKVGCNLWTELLSFSDVGVQCDTIKDLSNHFETIKLNKDLLERLHAYQEVPSLSERFSATQTETSRYTVQSLGIQCKLLKQQLKDQETEIQRLLKENKNLKSVNERLNNRIQSVLDGKPDELYMFQALEKKIGDLESLYDVREKELSSLRQQLHEHTPSYLKEELRRMQELVLKKNLKLEKCQKELDTLIELLHSLI